MNTEKSCQEAKHSPTRLRLTDADHSDGDVDPVFLQERLLGDRYDRLTLGGYRRRHSQFRSEGKSA